MDLDSQRKFLNKQQGQLRNLLSGSGDFEEASQVFLKHHAMLHSAKMSKGDIWSFEDAVLDDMSEEQMRQIPKNDEHSVAWCIWHLARIEDVAMNMLVADSQQVFIQDKWQEALGIDFSHTGNAMSDAEMAELSETINLTAMRSYRVAVGKRTREIFKALEPERLKEKVDPARVEKVRAEKAVIEAASEIADYWGKRNIAGLLLMPATRHNIVHLNEALRLKKKVH